MDDAGSILLLLTRGPSAYLPRHVPEYSWHFGSRGRPYTIYSSAYRTFSAASTHAPFSLAVITRIRLHARNATRKNSRWMTLWPRGRLASHENPQDGETGAEAVVQKVRFSRITIAVARVAMKFLQGKKLSATVSRWLPGEPR